MSWLSKLGHGLVKGAQIAQGLTPILAGVVPGGAAAFGIANAITGGVLRAQAAFPEPGSGTTKAQAVADEFEAALQTTKEIAAASGKTVTYDAALVKTATDLQVQAYKAIADAVASIRIVDTPPVVAK